MAATTPDIGRSGQPTVWDDPLQDSERDEHDRAGPSSRDVQPSDIFDWMIGKNGHLHRKFKKR